jgi:primosomal protein N' (replication factor Y)
LALDKEFSYSIGEEWEGRVLPGMRVLVRFGPRLACGYVTSVRDRTDFAGEVKPIVECLDASPSFNPELLAFLRWTADYYGIPLGELMRKALPPSLHVAERTVVELTQEGRGRLDEHPLLAEVARRGKVPLRTLLKQAPKADVERLVRAGLLTKENALRTGGAGESRTRIVRVDLFDPEKLKGPVQKALAQYVWEKEAVPVRELREHFKDPDRILRILEEKGVIRIDQVRTFRRPEAGMTPSPPPATLTPAQLDAAARLKAAAATGQYAPFLLHGVTGSGKTEVYMRTVDEVRALGRSALVLVPEIALTPQLMASFEARFPRQVAILHSALSAGERYDQWCQAATGALPIVLGARSAIFAPLPKLGLIVVDEEHEPSFKQDERPFYHARDLALVRGRQCGCTVVLGSATPSLESFRNARSGKLTLLRLPDRATARPLPDVMLVDLRKSGFVDAQKVLSAPLAAAIEENLAKGEQIILFLNRKGYAAFLLCESCGAVPRCRHCDVSLTYYRRSETLRCHYCQFGQAAPAACPACGAEGGLKQVGFGTERVVDALAQLFPKARVRRLDSTVSDSRNLPALLESFRKREVDILVGTQIVAKGHDFPGVTLVGVLLADLGLSFPDFRASERTFQLLTQVAGRAGRGERPGKVIIQTYVPTHAALVHAQRHGFEGFAAEELEQRRSRRFPPYSALALAKLSGENLDEVKTAAAAMREILLEACARSEVKGEVMGPGMSPLSYVRNRFRMQLLIRCAGRSDLQRLLRTAGGTLRKNLPFRGTLRWDIDIDPVNFM